MKLQLKASHMRKDIKPWYQYLTAETGDILKIRLHFQRGGTNLTTYQLEQGGYYLSITPMHRDIQDGMVVETMSGLAGIKFGIEASERYNQKRLTILAQMFDSKIPEIAELKKANDLEGINRILKFEDAKF